MLKSNIGENMESCWSTLEFHGHGKLLNKNLKIHKKNSNFHQLYSNFSDNFSDNLSESQLASVDFTAESALAYLKNSSTILPQDHQSVKRKRGKNGFTVFFKLHLNWNSQKNVDGGFKSCKM